MDRDAEVLDPFADAVEWRPLTSIDTTSLLTDDPAGRYRADNHGWFMGWSDNTGVSRKLPLCYSLRATG